MASGRLRHRPTRGSFDTAAARQSAGSTPPLYRFHGVPTGQHDPFAWRSFDSIRILAAKYAGFMIFRDGLRVLPYGRTDNDFFDIEYRRSKSVGREFWNHRQMFGRVAVTREHNPNLKDKAGREGLLDNRAAKTLKALIANILMQSARRYFGSASDLRRDLLPEISAGNRKAPRRRSEEKAAPTSKKAVSH